MGLPPLAFRPTAGVLIRRGDELLLVRRGAEPGRGRWDVPGGFLEPGERPEDGARREIREELGLELGSLRLLLTELNPLADGTQVLDLIFETRDFRGLPAAADDAEEARWFSESALPEELAFDATRRILERALVRPAGGELRLLGGERIELLPDECVAAFETPLDELPAGWRAELGEWGVHEGHLCGRIEGERPAVLWLEAELEGDHAISFDGSCVPPHAGDLNAYWEGSGTLLPGAEDVACTIGGLAGWWDGLSGIERHPEGGLRATARLFELEPGRSHRVVAGRRGSSDFLFVDGRLIMQVDDPRALRRERSRVALSTWNSHVRFTRAAAHRLR